MNTFSNMKMSNINAAYSMLYTAYMLRKRELIIANCKACRYLCIPQFEEKANIEMDKIYSMAGIKTKPIQTTIDNLPDNVLAVYAQACMNVLWSTRMQSFGFESSYAYNVLSQPRQFHDEDVLYRQKGNSLSVGNFLNIIKYALSIAEIIDPQNKNYAKAGANVLALQSIDAILNNKSNRELNKYTLHFATGFLASSVKDSLEDTNTKRGVAIIALMLNLAIDYLVREKRNRYDNSEK